MTLSYYDHDQHQQSAEDPESKCCSDSNILDHTFVLVKTESASGPELASSEDKVSELTSDILLVYQVTVLCQECCIKIICLTIQQKSIATARYRAYQLDLS